MIVIEMIFGMTMESAVMVVVMVMVMVVVMVMAMARMLSTAKI